MAMRIYVPQPGAIELAHVLPRSGIVGLDDEQEWVDLDTDRVLIYYEGNRFGYTNIKTWADRVRIAAGRARDRYPTKAMTVVPRDALRPVGYVSSDLASISVYADDAVAEWCGETVLPCAELGFTR